MIDDPPADAALLTAPPGLRLDGRTVWLTGASRGLGRALAFALAGAGAGLVVMARTAAALDEVVDTVRAHGGNAVAVAGSVDDPAAVAAAAEAAAATFGGVDVLVNNAGISPSFTRSETVDPAEWEQVLAVNVSGAYACCRAALPLMRERGGGSIVNVSSVHGSVGHERLAAYSASKGALELLTRTLAVEWAGHGIRVNAVAPGYVRTDMTTGLREHPRWREQLLSNIPLRRFADPAEITGAVLFLASDASSYTTGSTLFADGGWTAR